MSKSQDSTTNHINSLGKAKSALNTIKERLQPVVDKVNDNDFGVYSAQAHATVALSIGMLKYMAARFQGKDHGRKADDPLRAELNSMKRVLAEVKKKTAKKVNKADESSVPIKETEETKPDSTSEEVKDANVSSNTADSSISDEMKTEESPNSKKEKKRKSSEFSERCRSKSPKSQKNR